jgi:tagatose 6-phosphate kinase
MGPIGGHTGELLADLAGQEGLSAEWTHVRNETRTCIILVQSNQDSTVINDAGQNMDVSECKALIEDVLRCASRADLICTCGSLPPRFSQEQFKTLLSELISMGKQVWVDTSGEALRTALKVNGVCIKVNADELGVALDMKISNMDEAAKATRLLREQGISQIAVTLGKDGAVFNGEGGAWMARPPQIKVVSSVGSGDAFLGGLLSALEGGDSAEVTLRKAVAAGAANALQFGGGKLLLSEFEAIYKHM